MRSSAGERADAIVWNIARPAVPSRVPGVTMAGFGDRGLAPDGHRMVPHPAVMLALDLAPVPPVVTDANGERHRGSLVAGVGLGGAAWVRGSRIEAVQVRLSPVVAGAVLGVGPADLDGAVVTLEDLWGRRAGELGERLAEATTWQERFATIDALLGRRLEAASPAPPELAWAWRRIADTSGLVRIDDLAAELGWSRKRLWSRFHARLGLPPKRAARLVRFDRAAHLLAAGYDAARVAAEAGYADQPHLHREVVAFTGVTPTALADEPFLAVDDIAWAGYDTSVGSHASRARSATSA